MERNTDPKIVPSFLWSDEPIDCNHFANCICNDWCKQSDQAAWLSAHECPPLKSTSGFPPLSRRTVPTFRLVNTYCRLCKLTRLDLTMSYASYIHLIHPTDFQLAQVPPLRDFKIAGYAPPGTLVSLLSSFSQLEALELDVGRPKGLLPGSESSHTLNGDLLRFSSGSLR